jgi:hypothetical protein
VRPLEPASAGWRVLSATVVGVILKCVLSEVTFRSRENLGKLSTFSNRNLSESNSWRSFALCPKPIGFRRRLVLYGQGIDARSSRLARGDSFVISIESREIHLLRPS